MTDQPHYLGHRKRLKKRLLQSSHELLDHEVLELFLGYAIPRVDTKPLAKELLKRFGSLKGVFAARTEELTTVPGCGEGLQTFLTLSREFWARVQAAPVREREKFISPAQVAEMAKARLGHSAKEEFWLAMVDNGNRLICFERVHQGTVNQAHVFPREILAAALTAKASGIILVHNHPGGDPTPSRMDREMTERIGQIAEGLGVRLLDHVIVTEDNFYSFQAQGLLSCNTRS